MRISVLPEVICNFFYKNNQPTMADNEAVSWSPSPSVLRRAATYAGMTSWLNDDKIQLVSAYLLQPILDLAWPSS